METLQNQPLLAPIQIGDLKLTNRIAMSPMTRGRVNDPGLAPGELQALYYGQRASAGLIITEGTWVNKQSIGFNNVPGIFTAEQVNGWKKVTGAVHEKGGRIFLQLGHVGAVSHPDFLDGALPFGPSAVNINMNAYTPTGPQPTVVPKAMTVEEIKQTVADYKQAAQNALEAGFDGIEIHSQHPSLSSQFLSDYMNRRTDEYGGSIENKARFLFEVLDAVTAVWGENRVSIKLNPYISYVTTEGKPEETLPTYSYVANRLNDYKLAYLHILNQPDPSTTAEELAERDMYAYFRTQYKGLIMATGGFNQEKGNDLLAKGHADLVSFGTLFISNPDLSERFSRNLPLNEGDPGTYMFGDEKGYTDYAFIDHTVSVQEQL